MPSVVCQLPRDVVEPPIYWNERMSSSAPGQGQSSYYWQQYQPDQSTWSLNDLSSELLALIFQQLRDIDSQYIATARLLCRRFNQIAIPIAYRTLVLNERIVSPQSVQYFPQALEHIYTYTNHVVARSNLDPAGIKALLERIRKLSSVRWRYVDRSIRSGLFWMPSDILNAQQTRYHGTKLYVEELPLKDFTGDMRNIYLKAIPIELLVSLKLAHPAPPLVTRLSSLKTLLVSAGRLETLHFEDRGQGTQFSFLPNERFPPFRELKIRSYDWRHTPDEVARHWDFSRISSLELVSVPVFNFLASVKFTDFANLHTLHCEDFSAHLPDLRQEATSALYVLIKNYVRALSTLSITVHTSAFPVDALLHHAPALTTLRLRDHTGFAEDDRRCPTLHPADVALLAHHLRYLQVLELDMDTGTDDQHTAAFLRAVCAFPALHTLTLHVQTVIHPYDDQSVNLLALPSMPGGGGGGQDRDYEAAMRTLRFLVAAREQFVDGAGRSLPPWRSVTVNVGGWKRVMVRRLSEAWRRLNEDGVFAERCFVLERNASTGVMSVREEMPVEVGSRATTPEVEHSEEGSEEEDDEEDDDEEEDEEEDEDDDD